MTSTTPKPGSLGALLRLQLSQPQSAKALLVAPHEIIDVGAWYEQHVALLHQFLHRTLWAIAKTPARRNRRLVQALEQAHADLKRHTLKIAGDAVPTVLSRDGQYAIPYEKLAEARAKVQALTVELAQAREEASTLKVEGWRPEFDAMSPRQEELAIQFCTEIAGRRGEPGRIPDPVRLLEMAQALYTAERDALHSGITAAAGRAEPASPLHAVHWLPADDTEGGSP